MAYHPESAVERAMRLQEVILRAGGKSDPRQLTQVGRALQELGIQMVPAYSPQARGRSKCNFATCEGRLPQELRLRGIRDAEQANRFLSEEYIEEFNRRLRVAPLQPGTAFVPCRRGDLGRVFSIRQERTAVQDNTVILDDRWLEIEAVGWRGRLASCRVKVHEHLDGALELSHGPHVPGRYNAQGLPLLPEIGRRALIHSNRTDHVLQKPDILIC